jgi:hypothetical protein
MNAQSLLEAGSYEQTLLRIVRSLPTYQRAQLLDVAVLLEKRRISVSTELPIDDFGLSEERLWGRLATRSLAKDWDTREEDEAWAYLQKKT